MHGRGAGHGKPRSHRWLIFAAILLFAGPAYPQIQPGQLASDPRADATSLSDPNPAPNPVAIEIVNSYQPMTGAQRLRWFAGFTFGPEALAGALQRTGLGLLGRMGSNAFTEFWPDVHQMVFHR